jgi:hypothetical protein
MHVHVGALPQWRRGLEDVRYTKHIRAKVMQAVDQLLAGEDLSILVNDIKQLHERIRPGPAM